MLRKVYIYIILILISVIPISCGQDQRISQEPKASQEQLDRVLIPIEKGGKWGYIDANGNEVIKPQYSFAGYFSEGLAPFAKDNLRGYINTNNDIVIKPKYSQAASFVNDFAVIATGAWQDGNLRYGYIDKSGNELASPQFISAEDFTSDGYALVSIDKKDGVNYINGFIDKTGKIFIPKNYEIVSHFSDGLAIIKENGLYGYINTDFKIVLSPQYEELLPFSDEMAVIKQKGLYGFLSRNFEIIIPPQYDDVCSFNEGIAYASSDRGNLMIDKAGEVIRSLDFSFGMFSNGFAIMCKNGMYGFINREGKVVVDPIYERVLGFEDGLAVVEQSTENGYKWGVIDINSNIIIKPIYDKVEIITGGYIRTEIYNDNQYYIFNMKGSSIYSGTEKPKPTI